MTKIHELGIIEKFGFSTNIRKDTALGAVISLAKQGNARAVDCLVEILLEFESERAHTN